MWVEINVGGTYNYRYDLKGSERYWSGGTVLASKFRTLPAQRQSGLIHALQGGSTTREPCRSVCNGCDNITQSTVPTHPLTVQLAARKLTTSLQLTESEDSDAQSHVDCLTAPWVLMRETSICRQRRSLSADPLLDPKVKCFSGFHFRPEGATLEEASDSGARQLQCQGTCLRG